MTIEQQRDDLIRLISRLANMARDHAEAQDPSVWNGRVYHQVHTYYYLALRRGLLDATGGTVDINTLVPHMEPRLPDRDRGDCDHGVPWNDMPLSHWQMYHKEDHP